VSEPVLLEGGADVFAADGVGGVRWRFVLETSRRSRAERCRGGRGRTRFGVIEGEGRAMPPPMERPARWARSMRRWSRSSSRSWT
jgi:hypothetical protein